MLSSREIVRTLFVPVLSFVCAERLGATRTSASAKCPNHCMSAGECLICSNTSNNDGGGTTNILSLDDCPNAYNSCSSSSFVLVLEFVALAINRARGRRTRTSTRKIAFEPEFLHHH